LLADEQGALSKAVLGSTLLCTEGTWSGRGAFSYTYQWFHNQEPITGATNNRHTLDRLDLGQKVHCRVSVDNGAGIVSGSSAEFGPILHFDQVKPNVSILTPKSPGKGASWRALRVKITDAAPSAGVKSVKVRLFKRVKGNRCLALVGGRFKSMTCAKAQKTWTTMRRGKGGVYRLSVPRLAKGSWSMTALAVDGAGNQGTATTSFKIMA
jgi:hypothetical protein